MASKASSANQSSGKAFQIIEVMAEIGEPMILRDIALKSELNASTALRMLNTLMDYGYVRKDTNTQRYALSLKFARIARKVSRQNQITDIVKPYLQELSQKCGEAACFAMENNMEIVYLCVLDGPDGMLKIMNYIGKLAPMHCTGIGKILLLNYPENKLDEYIETKGLTMFTPHTIVTKKALLKELDKIRQNGYAVDDEECELGARCIAVGIRDYKEKYIGGISISGPTSRITTDSVPQLSKTVIEIAKKISTDLAYEETPLTSNGHLL